MKWLLIFELFYHGQLTYTVERMESEVACKKIAAIMTATVPTGSTQIRSQFSCTHIDSVDAQ